MRPHFSHRVAAAFTVACTALLIAGCGNSGQASSSQAKTQPSGSSTPSAAAPDTSTGRGPWLLALSSAGGADAEKATTTYITFDPSTGRARAHKMRSVSTPNTNTDEAPLLVSANRRWAIPDTGVSRQEERSGQLTVYSLGSQQKKVVDIRQRTGDSSLRAWGWAFDPQQAESLRVVDSKNRVWSVNVTGGKAVKTGTLAKGPWVFNDGFNHNTGQPYVESITNDDTNPPGNGEGDHSPVTREGGTVLGSDSAGFAALPKSPCRLGAAFVASDGTTWMFCADSATVRTFYLPKGSGRWSSYGQPSNAVAPIAAGFLFALPPPA